MVSINIFSFIFHYSSHCHQTCPPNPLCPILLHFLTPLVPLCPESLPSDLCTTRMLPIFDDLVRSVASSTIHPIEKGRKEYQTRRYGGTCAHLTPALGSLSRGRLSLSSRVRDPMVWTSFLWLSTVLFHPEGKLQ